MISYNILLFECSRKNIIVDGEYLFNEMLYCGVVFDLVSFILLIGMFFRNGDFDRVLMYFKEMKVKGLFSDSVIYIIFIDGFCKYGVMFEVLRIRDEMFE